MPGTLRDDILAIPGIDDAELEGDATSPDGVRVRLSYGADSQRVGREVRRILALHGMRSQLTDVPAAVAPAEPPPPPPPPGTVVNLSDYENGGLTAAAEPADAADEVSTETAPTDPTTAHDAAPPDLDQPGIAYEDAVLDESVDEAVSLTEAARESDRPEPYEAEDLVTEPDAGSDEPVAEIADEPAADVDEPVAPFAETGLAPLGNVAVIEGVSGVTVTASTRLGKTKSRTAPVSPGGVDRAIVSAVARLLVPDEDPPMLIEILDSDRDGELILTVVLELEAGQHAVGSSIQAANRSWAVARATRAALTAAE